MLQCFTCSIRSAWRAARPPARATRAPPRASPGAPMAGRRNVVALEALEVGRQELALPSSAAAARRGHRDRPSVRAPAAARPGSRSSSSKTASTGSPPPPRRREPAQEPRRRAEAPLEQRHDLGGVRGPDRVGAAPAAGARPGRCGGPGPAARRDVAASRTTASASSRAGRMRPRTSPSRSPRSTTSSPSSRNVRSPPSRAERFGAVPRQLDQAPSLPRSAPEIVPDAIRSPVRTLAPFEVACASCCGIVQ